MNELGEVKDELEGQEEEQQIDRQWPRLALLLLPLVFCCLFASSQLAIITGFNEAILVKIGPNDQIGETEGEGTPIGQLNPEIATEAARDAAALTITGTPRPGGVARIPDTPTPTPPPSTPTNTPRPTFTPAQPSPVPIAETPIAPTTVTPASLTPAPVSPTPVTSLTPISPTPVTPTPITPTPITPTPITPTPITPTPITPTPITPPPTEVPPPTEEPTKEPTKEPTDTPPPVVGVNIEPNGNATANPGDTVVYNHLITNIGNNEDVFDVTASSSQGFGVTKSLNEPLFLGPGASIPLDVMVMVPDSAAVGTVDQTTVIVTSASGTGATDSAIDTTTVDQTVGVDIEANNATTANPGQTVVYTHIVTNTGNSSDVFDITYQSSQGYSVTFNPNSPITLNGGESASLTVNITVPNLALAFVKDLTTILARSRNDPTISDSVVDTTTINQIAGVDIEADERGSANLGETVFYTHIVTNTGNNTDTINLSDSSSSAGFAASITPGTLVAVPPRTSKPINVAVTAPSALGGDVVDVRTITAASTNGPANDSVVDTTTLVDPNMVLNAAAGDQLVSLGWLTNPSATSYEVEYSVNGGPWSPLATITPGTADRYYHSGLANNATYTYQLKAFNGGVLIGYSNVATATPGGIDRTIRNCASSTPILVQVVSDPFDPTTCQAALDDIDGATAASGSNEGLVLVFPGGEVTLDYGTGPRAGIVDGPGYDFVYYALPVTNTITGTVMFYAQVEVSTDGSSWTTVFNWDGIIGDVEDSNIATYGADGEDEGEAIPPADLFPDPGSPPPDWNTGVAIDISTRLPAGIHYGYIRFSRPMPPPGPRNNALDAIYRIN